MARLRRLVDETDGYADDDPLNEVGDPLVQRERKADVQSGVVVKDEVADRETADEYAEVYAGGDATACGIDFCVENGDDHDADQDRDDVVGHDLHHVVMRAVDVGVLHELRLHAWQGAEHDEAATEIGDGCAEKRESDAKVVHGLPFEAGLGLRRILHGKAFGSLPELVVALGASTSESKAKSRRALIWLPSNARMLTEACSR